MLVVYVQHNGQVVEKSDVDFAIISESGGMVWHFDCELWRRARPQQHLAKDAYDIRSRICQRAVDSRGSGQTVSTHRSDLRALRQSMSRDQSTGNDWWVRNARGHFLWPTLGVKGE